MTIDTSGEWWKGSEPADLRKYLEAFTAEGYKAEEFRLSVCACGSDRFHLLADQEEGGAERTCIVCNHRHLICDSAECWEEAEPIEYDCVECASKTCNVGVGYALRETGKEIRWIYIGVRCTKCGILGCITDWKVSYAPTRHMLEQA
jgi:hypothetical protein